MKSIIITLITIFLAGCQTSSSHERVVMLNNHKHSATNAINTQNPNSIANKALEKQKEKQEDRKNKIELSKIDAQTKIEIEKIKSQNQLQIAKVEASIKKEMAKTDSSTKVKISQIDATTKKDDVKIRLYTTIAVVVISLFALFLFYLNSKRNRELKNKMHKEELEQERLLKERELEEQRLHKMLELVGGGKLSLEMEKEVILSLTQPKSEPTLIETDLK